MPIPTLPSTIKPLVGAATEPYELPTLVLPNTLNLLPVALRFPIDTKFVVKCVALSYTTLNLATPEAFFKSK